jgi:hypothetical protein
MSEKGTYLDDYISVPICQHKQDQRVTKESIMKKMKYEEREIHPELAVKLPAPSPIEHVIWRSMSTKQEANIFY